MRALTSVMFLLPVLVVTLLPGCGPSPEKVADASKACIRFYEEQRLPNWFVGPEVTGAWTKNGKLVVELAIKESKTASSYTPRICVVDEDKGTISLPALIDQARWEK